jgi:hypothetical protein
MIAYKSSSRGFSKLILSNSEWNLNDNPIPTKLMRADEFFVRGVAMHADSLVKSVSFSKCFGRSQQTH